MNRKERRAARKQAAGSVAQIYESAFRHHQAGQLAEADRLYRQVLAIDSDHVGTLHYLGLLAHQAGRNDLAVTLLAKAVALDPRLDSALDSLATIFFLEGDYRQALAAVRGALAVKETEKTKSLFVECVKGLRGLSPGDDLRDIFVRALSEPWGRPSELAPVAAALIRADGIVASSNLAALAGHRVLRALLESAPVCDLELERCLTGARRALLEAADEDGGAHILDFACALARQCFINEYVFAHTDEEFAQAVRLRDRVRVHLDRGASVPPLWLAIVGCYLPLHTLPASLLDATWPDAIAGLLAQQVREPARERELRTSIPRLTPIDDEVSRAVRQQYEENPYPRWVKLPPPGRPVGIDSWLRGLFPSSGLRPLAKPSVDVLIAGCGTGQQAIEAAQDLGARVLAIDLSLASLAYAMRKTRELGLQNIEYGQADLLALASLGRSFDVIEATGSLQALAAPMAGWRVLISLLRPGGLMKVGLYSELARASVVAARLHITDRGYSSGSDDIRRCRQELLSDPALRQVAEFGDFFTVSNCRDLLFHVQEHRSTLPEIAAFLAENGLSFIGFELDAAVQRRYATRFPDDKAMTDLAQWHIFETENPKIFMGMYQFWLQKR
jgi:2-polyprenyl-3-methyl-5-hydroxy-6-metoxy-1,4-benzoquinol methylase/tetratricopeptide (TPR) repeat protein